ncbi:MAG: DUF4065 domain-containing protein [Treponema sp.]|nr:DUF4065 domain-containing protein [Treponema sp.]
MMTSVFDVANYILQLGKENVVDGEYDLTPMKLQKLVYYCQGFHLALYDKPLFPETIEAWKHGPVCPPLYRALKPCGSALVFEIDAKDSLTEAEKQLVADVYWKYGQFATWKLRSMTHEEAPWLMVPSNGTISSESMTDFFNKHFFEVNPQDIPPLTGQERVEIGKAFEELEASGELSISQLR